MAKRRLLGGLILCLALSAGGSEPPTTVMIGTPPQPGWAQLSPQQRGVLSPLEKSWDSMENVRKRKWLGIAERYPNMKSDEQQRVQERMREWARLTPEQRAKIRDSYKDFKQLPAEQKQAVRQKWEAYSNLPPEEKQRVRESGKSAKLLPQPATPDPALAEDSIPQAAPLPNPTTH